MKAKIHFLIISLFLIPLHFFAQGIIIQSDANFKLYGTAELTLYNGSLTNAGTFSPGSGAVVFSGTSAQATNFNGSAVFNTLTITNTGGITLNNNTTTAALNITTGALTVPAGKNLTATGTTTLNSPQCLVLKAGIVGTASFKDNGNITINNSGTALIERYLTPYSLTSDLKFHFISSPVGNAQPIQNEFLNLASNDIIDFYKWNEVANEWTNFRGTAFNLRNESFGDGFNFLAGVGYMVAYPVAVTKNFIGAPYTNQTGLTINCTNTSNRGWNLLGNPFPSSIDWDYIVTNGLGNGMENALYYYDNDLPNYKYYIKLTGSLGPEASGGSRYIPAMQGFMVHAKTSGTTTVTLTNAARTHVGQDIFYKKSEQLMGNILNMKVEGNGMSDYARVCFYDQASANFDGDFDAYKIFSYSAAMPQLYTFTDDNTSLAINTLPLAKLEGTVSVGFKVGMVGNYIFTAENLQSFNVGSAIILKDLKTANQQNLTEKPEYAFTSALGDNANRFELVFADFTGIKEPVASDFNIYATNNTIYIRNDNANEPYTVMVSNMLGQMISKSSHVGSSLNQLTVNQVRGMYVVTVISKGATYSRKVIIK